MAKTNIEEVNRLLAESDSSSDDDGNGVGLTTSKTIDQLIADSREDEATSSASILRSSSHISASLAG